MQQWEGYRQKPVPERCHVCGSDSDLTVFDGWGYGPEPLDEPGTAVLLCDRCQAGAYRAVIAAEAAVVAEDDSR